MINTKSSIRPKGVLFDFDGTLSDSLLAMLKTYESISKTFKLKSVEKINVQELRSKNSKELLKELKIPLIKLPLVVKKARYQFQKEVDDLKPVHGILAALLQLKEEGYQIGILSSNSKENVLRFLKQHEMDIFDFIYCEASVFGKSKLMKKCLHSQNFKKNEIVYIGDETRDIEAAKITGIKIISVTWGFNTPEVLKKSSPDQMIQSAHELCKAVAGIFAESCSS